MKKDHVDNSYTGLADVYDDFMSVVPCDAWCSFITERLSKYGINDGLVCDLGCGSGTITTALADAGYDMTGIDGSNEMLQKAQAKKGDRNILYLEQDITAFELYGTMRAMVSTGDTLNYITDKADLKRVFRLAANYLDPGGIFIFDMHTPRYYAGLGNGTYGDSSESAAYIWTNAFNRATGVNECELTLFVIRENGLYERSEEMHIQRAYSEGYIKRMIKKAGFDILERVSDYSEKKAGRRSDRVTYVIRKKD